jgi:tetratricopeptide (TPR) repeat protein
VSAIKLEPKNLWYKVLLTSIYENQQKFESAAKVYNELISANPLEISYYFDLIEVYRVLEDESSIEKTFTTMELRFGALEEIILEKHKFYFAINQYDKAVTEINKLISNNPTDLKYLKILAQTYNKANNEIGFFKTLEKIKAISPDDDYSMVAEIDYFYRKGEVQRGHDLFIIASKKKNITLDQKMAMIGKYYAINGKVDSENFDKVLSITEGMMVSHPEDYKVYSLRGEVFQQTGKNKEAKVAFKKAISLKKNDFTLWQQLLFLEIELKDYISLEKEALEAEEYFPQQPLVYFFMGISRIELKKYPVAVDALKTGLGLIYKNQTLELQFYNYLAEAYYRQNLYKDAFDNFEKAIILDPKNSLALNNYAYYLSLQNMDLEKAETMSAKTIQIDPANASYQDTYGYILFKRGKYVEAEKWLSRAVENEPNSADVLEHYGDVLFQIGRVDEAVTYWQKAKKAGSESKNIDIKIAEKKL